MTILDLQNQIRTLKKERDICILVHSYQNREIVEVADYIGDSYALAKLAADVPNKTIIMCGVRFMAETVKILCPDKTVYLSNPDAGCPMAEQMDKESVLQMKEQYPGYAVVAYINTTAELKTVCDVCVTSSSAVKIVKAMPQDHIIFIPDHNLGTYVKNQVPQKTIQLVQGGCPAHAGILPEAVISAKKNHPGALFLVHPECLPEVAEQADYVGSTSGIIDYAKKSGAGEFIIGTENSIAVHLQYECPDKRFYPLSKDLVCHNMRLTTLTDLLDCCNGTGGEVIHMEEETRLSAKRSIDRMIAYGG